MIEADSCVFIPIIIGRLFSVDFHHQQVLNIIFDSNGPCDGGSSDKFGGKSPIHTVCFSFFLHVNLT